MHTTVNNLAFIVEDNEMFAKMLNHTLSNSGVCQFISFKSGEECVSNLYMNPFLIIMDYGLPGMDGLKTFRTIKEYNLDIPVIVLTGTNDVKIGSDFLNDGAYAFLLKQKSTTHEVIKIINEILDNKGTSIKINLKPK